MSVRRMRQPSIWRASLLDPGFHIGRSKRFWAGKWDFFAYTTLGGPGRLWVLEDELWAQVPLTSKAVPRLAVDCVRFRKCLGNGHLIKYRLASEQHFRWLCRVRRFDPVGPVLAKAGWPVKDEPSRTAGSSGASRDLVEVGRLRDWGWIFITDDQVWCEVRLRKGVVTRWVLDRAAGDRLCLVEEDRRTTIVRSGLRAEPSASAWALRPDQLRYALERHGWTDD